MQNTEDEYESSHIIGAYRKMYLQFTHFAQYLNYAYISILIKLKHKFINES